MMDYRRGIKLTHADVFLVIRALEDYQNRELQKEKEALLKRFRALEKKYEALTK